MAGGNKSRNRGKHSGSHSRKSSQNATTAAPSSTQVPETKNKPISSSNSDSLCAFKSVQFQSDTAANKNEHFASFLTSIRCHPDIVSSSFSPNGKRCTLVFNSVESCERWHHAFSKVKFKQNCASIISTSSKPTADGRLTLQIFKVNVTSFTASTSFEKNPMFRITPGHDDDSTQAQNLAHLVTPDYYTQTLGNNTQAHPSQTARGIQFKRKQDAERYLDFLKNAKLDFKYMIVEALKFEESSGRRVQAEDLANRRSKSSSPCRAGNSNSSSSTVKLQSNAAFLIFDAKNFNSEIARNIDPLADIITLPKNVVHVQFSKQAQAEEFFQLLKERQVLKHTYKLTSYLKLKMPSADHRLLTCMIWFTKPPTKAKVRELLPRAVTDFDISKQPKQPKQADDANKRQWFIHCEFESSEIAQKSLIPLLQSLKLLNPNNHIFPTHLYVNLYDKERGICSHKEQVPPVAVGSGELEGSPVQNGNRFQATFRGVSRGEFGFVKISPACREFVIWNVHSVFKSAGDAVLPNLEYIRQALHKDTVEFCIDTRFVFEENSRKLLEITDLTNEKLSQCRLVARVLKIVTRDRSKVVGALRRNHSEPNRFVMTPKLSALPYFDVDAKDIEGEFNENAIYKATICKDRYGFVKDVCDLGIQANNYLEAAMEQLFVYYDIHHESWVDEILDELPVEQEAPDFTRRDFRNNTVFTIDPRTCRDMDDAIHITRISDQVFELGVHIADVSYYVNETKSPNLWRHATRQSTSYYFPHTVVHMLPEKLSANLCSLCPHVDRFTMSMTWKVDARNWRIIDDTFWYGRGVIRSRAKMAYEDVQEIFNEFDRNGGRVPDEIRMYQLWQQFDEKHAELDNYVPVLSKFQQKQDMQNIIVDSVNLLLFTRALEAGRNRLVIYSKMRQFVNFHLDNDENTPTDVSKTTHIEANRVIENLMLLANEWAARTITQTYPETAMIRKHPGLNAADFIKALHQLETIIADPGLLQIIQAIKSVAVSPSSGDLASVMQRINSSELKIFFSNLISMNMSPAEYTYPSADENTATGVRHFALNLDLYTHFTSPIRRFPDIIVHQQLLRIKSDTLRDPIAAAEICRIANERKLASRESQSQAEMTFFAAYLNLNYGESGLKLSGLVDHVDEKGFCVSCPSFGGVKFEAAFHLLDDVTGFQFYPRSNCVELVRRTREREERCTLKMFDLIDVRLTAPKLDIMLENPIQVQLC